jgi:hypothetical protein
MTRRQRKAGFVLLPILAWGGDALAYRPFDGTDAAVAEFGQVEVELGPAQYLQIGPERTLVAPTVVLNYGISEGWELVLQGEVLHSLMQDSPKSSLVGNGLFLKAILREGSLQGQPGPSIATEFGFLLPSINDDPTNSTGGSVAGIVSQQWPWLTVHFNAALALTHQQTADAFVGLILEGPHDWPLATRRGGLLRARFRRRDDQVGARRRDLAGPRQHRLRRWPARRTAQRPTASRDPLRCDVRLSSSMNNAAFLAAGCALNLFPTGACPWTSNRQD